MILRGSNWLKILVVVLWAGTIAVSGLYVVRERERYFDLEDQLENITTEFNRLQRELVETMADYEDLQHSYDELKEFYDELDAKYLELIEYSARPRFMTFSNLTITPQVVDLADNVTISFYITNLLQAPGEYSFATHVEGPGYGYEIMDGISMGGCETKKISYTVTPEAYGNHTVSIDRLAGCFEVVMVVS